MTSCHYCVKATPVDQTSHHLLVHPTSFTPFAIMSRPAKKSNIELLTQGASYIQRAKQARRDQIEDIKFDDDARRFVLLCGRVEQSIPLRADAMSFTESS